MAWKVLMLGWSLRSNSNPNWKESGAIVYSSLYAFVVDEGHRKSIGGVRSYI